MPDNGDAPFNLVTEPIVLPMTRTELADDYTLTVGFDNGKAATPAPKPQKPHKPQPGEDRRSELTKRGASGFLPQSVEDTQRKSPEASASGAEGATAPETLRPMDRWVMTLWKVAGAGCASAHRRG